jgi:hypothetical protein
MYFFLTDHIVGFKPLWIFFYLHTQTIRNFHPEFQALKIWPLNFEASVSNPLLCIRDAH